MLHHSSIADGQRIRQCGPRDCSSGDDDDDDADADDAMQRGIDLIFIISLTFRRGKLGLVCASLMLPITSSLLKYLNGSRTGAGGVGPGPHTRTRRDAHVPLPTPDSPDQGVPSS